ncbi:MAG: GNAT family N-acetyltransferase [Spirochaetaceae bacterium]|nr:GNAT family N-acetyltransferase [Spirochaetaceae bacterium]
MRFDRGGNATAQFMTSTCFIHNLRNTSQGSPAKAYTGSMKRLASLLSRGDVLAISTAILAVFMIFGYPALGSSLAAVTPDGGAFDLSFIYSPAEAVRKASLYTEAESVASIRVHWTLDLAFPLAYGLFCASAWAFALRRLAGPAGNPRFGILIVPLAAMAFDLAENAAVAVLLAGARHGVPAAPGVAAVCASAATALKWTFASAAFGGVPCLVLAAAFAESIRKRRSPARAVVERAVPDDLPAVMRLEEAGFDRGVRELEEVFRARMEVFPEGFVALRRGGETIGYLCAERWGEVPPAEARWFELGHDPASRHDPAGAVLYLASMTVDPALRGSGLGSRMLNEGIALIRASAPGIRTEVLIVNEAWAGARRIYEAAGFTPYGRIESFFRNPYGPPTAAVAMRR